MAAGRRTAKSSSGSQPVTLQKGDQIETTTSPARAVALRYDGFREVDGKLSQKDVQAAKPAGSTTTVTNQ